MDRVGVMQLIDALDRGGAERVVVNLANHLPRDRFRPFLCTTRRDGALAGLVSDDVERLQLFRKTRFEWRPIRQLVAYVRSRDIRILHAHGTSLFVAALASLFPPYPKLIWHDHYGESLERRASLPPRVLTGRARAIIAVSRPLLAWARTRLRFPPERTWLIPNFVVESAPEHPPPTLPGAGGPRIVCVANLRPQKDHPTLVRAMDSVARAAPSAHLLLVGAAKDAGYLELVRGEVARRGLGRNVAILGERADVMEVLRACDIGVLSSIGEALPLALLEYGLAGLPAVATSVGDCPEVLDHGRAGLLVPAGDPDRLAAALLSLLRSAADRATLGERLRARVRERYAAARSLGLVGRVYEAVLDERDG